MWPIGYFWGDGPSDEAFLYADSFLTWMRSPGIVLGGHDRGAAVDYLTFFPLILYAAFYVIQDHEIRFDLKMVRNILGERGR